MIIFIIIIIIPPLYATSWYSVVKRWKIHEWKISKGIVNYSQCNDRVNFKSPKYTTIEYKHHFRERQ